MTDPSTGGPPGGTLSAYREKRDFARTPEPAEGGIAGRGIFVVQHHWARREHYDVRLELDGVLVSFAVAKGPSLDPSQRRLAVRTEDHPLSYADFEGTIPKGEYGGGTVMLFDRGHWAPMSPDPQAALAAGELKFVLLGERMQGGWVLVRMNVEKGRENWLLIKERDDWARRGDDSFPARFDTSVATGRTRAGIEREEAPHSFAEDRAEALASGSPAPSAPPKADRAPPTSADDPPAFVPPALCAVFDAAPDGDDWLHEIKYDGYRIQAAVDGDAVRLFSREGLDWTHRMPGVRQALAGLGLKGALLDGEAVVFGPDGLTDFPALVAALDRRNGPIAYVVFDLIAIDGKDLRARRLDDRKARLQAVLGDAAETTVRLAPTLIGNGPAVFRQAVEGGAEGIIAKRRESPYRSGRGTAWGKVKGDRREDVVVVGYLPSDKRAFRSLHGAVETPTGLRYVGGVGTGFSARTMEQLKTRLDARRRSGPPTDLTGHEAAPKGLVWVEPTDRIEVRLAGFTGDGHLRQARFLGLREDRAPLRGPATAATDKGNVLMSRTPASPGKAKRKAGRTAAADAALLARITHPERIVFPDVGVTKGMVADHYLTVADRILPHLDGRPVSFVRAPEGLSGETFFQRHVLPGMKEGIVPVTDPEGRHENYLAIEGRAGLITAAQFGVIELHGWNARLPDLAAPDRMVFDFDPDEGLGFDAVKEAAETLRRLLEAVGLTSFPLASGGKGLHVVVPLDRTQTLDDLGDFTGGVAKGMAKAEPKRYVAVAAKARRSGRIFIDWLRNRPYSTAILPWSLRARPTASVAVPLSWREVPKLAAANALGLREAARRADPWEGFFDIRQRIDPDALAFLKRSLPR